MVQGKYTAVDHGGILHTLNYLVGLTEAKIYGARVTPSLLGEGYVEAVPEDCFRELARKQSISTDGKIKGQLVRLGRNGNPDTIEMIGHFGWKAQHASLLDASADALMNELGVANRIFPGGASSIVSSRGTSRVSQDELDAMATFVRDLEPIAPDLGRSNSRGAPSGSRIFDQIGCSICHVRTLKTAPPGTRMPGSGIVVSERLGNKEIHPFSDYMLHDVGTGDGIVQNVRPEDYDQSTANKFRTAPLWGLRYRLWMMHDGQSVTYHQAIMRHRGEALSVTLKYANLSPAEQRDLEEFLASL